jgi:hypothetical protein
MHNLGLYKIPIGEADATFNVDAVDPPVVALYDCDTVELADLGGVRSLLGWKATFLLVLAGVC